MDRSTRCSPATPSRGHRARRRRHLLVGFIDDIRALSAPAKVTGTVLAGLVLVWFGVTMFYFRVPFVDVFFLTDDWVPLITVLWLLGMTQAINLIDGLDGLAAGIVAIAAGAFFLYSQRLADLELLAPAQLGPLVGDHRRRALRRLPAAQLQPGPDLHGRRRGVAARPADGGVDERRRRPGRPDRAGFIGQTFFFLAPLFIPLFILGVPILDTLFAIVRRADAAQALATADKGHLHHRLMNLGHGQRRSVLILWRGPRCCRRSCSIRC